ncbi:MAG: hypothetical protein H0Z34_10035 [Brevibacillus sp.]|nr:hypothetical protein [Brevibacillus sp.]
MTKGSAYPFSSTHSAVSPQGSRTVTRQARSGGHANVESLRSGWKLRPKAPASSLLKPWQGGKVDASGKGTLSRQTVALELNQPHTLHCGNEAVVQFGTRPQTEFFFVCAMDNMSKDYLDCLRQTLLSLMKRLMTKWQIMVVKGKNTML